MNTEKGQFFRSKVYRLDVIRLVQPFKLPFFMMNKAEQTLFNLAEIMHILDEENPNNRLIADAFLLIYREQWRAKHE